MSAVSDPTSGTDAIRVLAVDDEPGLAELTATFLERADDRFTIATATNVDDGLERVAADDVECIVSDYDMPGRNGLDFLGAVREEHPDLPFVLFTGRGSEEVASEAISAGVTDYLQKETGGQQYVVLANRIAFLVERYRTREKFERQRRQYEALSTLGRRALERPAVETLCEEAVELLGDVLETECASVLRHRPAGDDTSLVAVAECDGQSCRVESDPVGAINAVVGSYDDPWGVIETRAVEGRAFLDSDVTFVENVANVLATAIENVEAERRLRESERRFREIADLSPDGIFRCGTDGRYTYASAASERLLAVGEDELLGRHFEEFVDDEIRDTSLSVFDAVLDGEEIDALEVRLVDAAGEPFDAEVNVRPVFDDGGDDVVAMQGLVRDVSEQKAGERRLQRSRERYQHVVEHFPDGVVFRFDEELRYTLAGGAELAKLEIVPDELEGKRARDVVTPEMFEVLKPRWEATLRGEPQEYEQYVEEQCYRIRTIPIRDADGDVVAGMAVGQNVTEQKDRERRLELLRERTYEMMHTGSREETAHLAVDTVDDIVGAPYSTVWFADDGEVLEPVASTDEAREAFDPVPTFRRGAEPGSRAAVVWEAFECGEPVAFEDTRAHEPLREESPARSALLHPLGDHGVLIVSSPEPGVYGETERTLVEILANALSTALDRVEREQGIRTRERRLERLHRASQELMRAETEREVAERVVAAAEEVLGFSIVTVRLYEPGAGLAPACASDPVSELFESRTLYTAEGESLNWQAFEAGEAAVYEDIADNDDAHDAASGLRSLMIHPLGEYGTFAVGETVSGAFEETDVFLAGILATMAETALEAVARTVELRESQATLESRNEHLAAFASVVSHDLRNPLNVAQGRLELARRECDSEHLQPVERAHARMAALVDDLLTLAREGERVDDVAAVDLSAVVEECWSNVDTKAASLVVETDTRIRADRSRLQQLFENLVGNAIEHGGDDVTVTVGRLEDGFYVEDDGPGIPEDERERVFQPGYSTNPDGTGIGLRIVVTVASAHGWRVTLADAEGGGARFEFAGVER